MDTEQFHKQFNGLDSQIKKLDNTLNQEKRKIGELEKNLGPKKFMQEVLSGLKTTPDQPDPGKYGPAYYFVKEITSNDVERTNEPSLLKPCPRCGEERVVVMSYEQTTDSPTYDEWKKQTFVICPNDGAYKLETFSKSERF